MRVTEERTVLFDTTVPQMLAPRLLVVSAWQRRCMRGRARVRLDCRSRATAVPEQEPEQHQRLFSDDLVSGVLTVRQSAQRGAYRFGLDALLLATDLPDGLLQRAESPLVLDLGAGSGVVGLCVASRHAHCTVLAVERQLALAELARHNAAAAGFSHRMAVCCADVRDQSAWLSSQCQSNRVTLLLCNPPFYYLQPAHSTAAAVQSQRLAARHELHGTLGDFVAAASAVHATAAKFVIPPQRLPDLLTALPSGYNISSLRFVHAAPGEEAYLVEVFVSRSGSPMGVKAPLFVRGEDGRYTRQVALRMANAARADGRLASEAEVQHIRDTCVRRTHADKDNT